MSAPTRTFTVRNIQLLRALFAAAAALMITFSPDHSAAIGFAVFGGFAAASGFIFVLGAWLTAPAGARWPFILLGVIDILTAIASGVPAWRTDGAFFVVVIAWAAASGLVELIAGLRSRRTDPTAKDAIIVGALGLLLAVVLLIIPVGYSLQYSVDDAEAMTLTGIILAVGMVGGYTAIVAVFLAIAGFSPNRPGATDAETTDAETPGDETPKDVDTDEATSASVETGGTA